MRIGIATGSRSNWADTILGRLGVADLFEAIAATGIVAAGRPSLDLLLAARSELSQSSVSLLSDSLRGIVSAKAAGLTVVTVRTGTTAGMDVPRANYVIDNLSEFDFAWLAR